MKTLSLRILFVLIPLALSGCYKPPPYDPDEEERLQQERSQVREKEEAAASASARAAGFPPKIKARREREYNAWMAAFEREMKGKSYLEQVDAYKGFVARYGPKPDTP
jgi:starvation-inducible outer membrane lipoprotein